jgi:prephenate dehydratase/chorismate mutase
MALKLKDVREKIDRVDFEILNLLKKRIELALMTKKLKKEVADPQREKEILDRITKKAKALGLLDHDFVEKIFTLNISESKKVQGKSYSLAGFQGEYGAYSEIAALRFNTSLVPIALDDFSDVFENVSNDYLDLGVVPVENSIGGAIHQVNDLLIDTKLKVVGEIKLPIKHCLLALPNADYKDLKTVYSHPQALSQCRSFLQRNKLEGRPYYDTAGAAKMLSTQRPEASAVIASSRCAQLYDLEIIKEGIEDHSQNYTRFLILSRTADKSKTNNKCSIIFSVQDRAGALFEVLEIFADAKINLTRIESMPRRDAPGNYYFFLDFMGNNADKKVYDILKTVEESCDRYNFLGCYKGDK